MIFRANEITVIIPEDIICELNRYYIGNEKEVGGILLGRFAGGIIYEVTEMACINSCLLSTK